MGRELLAQEPVLSTSCRRGERSVWPARRLVVAGRAHSRRASFTDPGDPFRATGDLRVAGRLAALWRSWGVEPAAVLGHSAGEMAATLHCRRSFARGCGVRDLPPQPSATPNGRARRDVGGGDSRSDEAMQLVERHPRAISIAAINGANSITLSGDAAVLAEIDKTLNEADVFSRPLRSTCLITAPKMEQLQAELMECLRRYSSSAASIPFLLHRDRHRSSGTRNRRTLLVPEYPATGALP